MNFFNKYATTIIMIIIVVLGLIIYFFWMYHKFTKNTAKLLELQNNLKVGEVVLLASGIIGNIVEIGEHEAKIQVDQNCVLRVNRYAITTILNKNI